LWYRIFNDKEILIMEKLYGMFGGRKMLFALILLVIATIFLFTDKSDFGGWSNFVIWIFGTYCVGNGMEHLSETKLKKKNK
jgi:hypothetical protein